MRFCLIFAIFRIFVLKQKVCIYSDYDTDAVTATGVMYHGLIDLGFDSANLEFYAPDRFTEGYGMNTEAVAELATKFDLIISVDCGINSTAEADIVSTTKCDLIITDHHHLQDQTPNCTSVINCRLAGEYAKSKPLYKAFSTNSSKVTKKLLTQIAKAKPDQESRIKEWLEKSTLDSNLYTTKPEKFLSPSVTGVGVAWFSLVWLGYFLEFVGV
jgi:single-stranded DNA-specific DHH superfamily exonuclease